MDALESVVYADKTAGHLRMACFTTLPFRRMNVQRENELLTVVSCVLVQISFFYASPEDLSLMRLAFKSLMGLN